MKRVFFCMIMLVLLLAAAAAEERPPMIALTFDDGPSEYTKEMLELLEENDCRATFFMIGQYVEMMPEMPQIVADSGCEVGTHTLAHRPLNELSEYKIYSDLDKCINQIEELTGEHIRWLRPPWGKVSAGTYVACRRLDLLIVKWSLDSKDWESRDAEKIMQQILENVKDGDVILCHDTYPETLEAMRIVLPELKARGYELVTVSELFSHFEGELKSTTFYYRLN